MIGLAVLVLFVLMALAAPLLADEAGLSAVNSTGNPAWASPSDFGPLGTDKLGRSIWTQLVWGARVSLLVGLAATIIATVIGMAVGITAGLLRRCRRRGADAADGVVPGDPVPAAGDRARRRARALDPEHHHRDRHHLLAVDGAAGARAGADAEAAPVRRPQPRARRVAGPPDDPPHPAERVGPDPRQHDAHRAGRDPLGDDALVPRLRRPVAPLVGQDARGGVQRRER